VGPLQHEDATHRDDDVGAACPLGVRGDGCPLVQPLQRVLRFPRLTFADDPAKRTQYTGFLKKLRLDKAPANLHEVIATLWIFLQPVATAVREAQPFAQQWIAPEPWRVG
jgi:hypothetical protein